MKNSKFLLIPLLLITLVACKKSDSTEDPASVPSLFPLKIGNTWNFKSTKMDTVITNHFNKVIKDTTLLDETWAVLTYDNAVNSILKNKLDGLWFVIPTKSTSGNTAILYYKYPVASGTQYMTPDSVNVTVVSTNESVTVPMGTFACYHYTMRYANKEVYQEYFCPGTGLVKIEKFYVNGAITVLKEKVELVSAVLN